MTRGNKPWMGRDLNAISQVPAVMIVIVAIGYIFDGLIFQTMERWFEYRWGLKTAA